MFEIVYDDDDDGRTTDGRRLDGYTISSPCEPNGSGELKSFILGMLCINRLEEHHNMIRLFNLTKLVETCAKKYHCIIPGTSVGILPHVWNKHQGM